MAENELYLYGSVGASWWEEEWFTPGTVRDWLAGRSGPITVRINSGGGIASDGQAIYTQLVDYPGEVHVIVDGAAASAASLIAMAGDTITMRLGSFMLIHDPACPWTEGRGTEDEHRKLADQLAITSRSYAAIYAKKSGMSVEDAREMMRDDTLLDGAGAMAKGLCTSTDDSVTAQAAARFDYRIYRHSPAELRQASEGLGRMPAGDVVMSVFAGRSRGPVKSKEQIEMAKKTSAEVVAGEDPAADDLNANDLAPKAPEEEEAAAPDVVARVLGAERRRVQRITDAVAMAKLPAEFGQKLIADGINEAKAVEMITAKWKDEGDVDMQMVGRPTAKVGMEAREKFVAGAEKALLARTMLKGGERNEFSSLTLSELARMSLEMGGDTRKHTDRLSMIGAAFTMSSGMHSTGDFGNILANVMGKAALQGWEEAEETYEVWTRKGSLSDFKATKRVGAGLFGPLAKVAEGAEYTYGTVGDRGEPIVLSTYGKILRISRQAIINDDLSILSDLPRKMGRAAKATIGDLVYGVLTSNPTMSDSVALFHSSHSNLAGTGTALSVSSLGAAKAAMKTQKETLADGTSRVLNISPAYLIVPAAQEIAAQQLIASTVDPTASKGHAMNPVANMAKIVADGRLDATSTLSWYLAANPAMFDTIEVAYLDGNDQPWLEQQAGWTVDGVDLKVRMDAGVAPLDFRTLYKNPGA